MFSSQLWLGMHADLLCGSSAKHSLVRYFSSEQPQNCLRRRLQHPRPWALMTDLVLEQAVLLQVQGHELLLATQGDQEAAESVD